MSTYGKGHDESWLAAADLSASQFCVVKMSAAKTVALGTAATDVVIGVLQNKPAAAGRAATVRHFGFSKAKAGAVITAGDELSIDSSGRVILAAPATKTTHYLIGRAVTAAAAANDIIEILVCLGIQHATHA